VNVHASTEDTIEDVKGSFYGELERVFDKFDNLNSRTRDRRQV
jgi:hypothetical protein